jgi:succinate-semialdehyde dehydrogenase/glutarate-semialdehyde dehydrogenase
MADTSFEMKKSQLFINGRWIDGETGNTYDVINPATEDSLATIAYGTRVDAKQALEAAQAAMPAWQGLTVYDRSVRLKKTGRADA